MRIGILTFHRAVNYGAVLQAMALQKILQKQGCNCEIINYKSPCIETDYLRCGDNIFNIKVAIYFIISLPIKLIIKYKFNKYIEDNLVLNSRKPLVKKQLNKLNSSYDSFIVGSDQIWNYDITQFDTSYLLDFVNTLSKKNSYAASFGITKIPYEYKESYCKYLTGFNLISVREDSGAVIIRELIKRAVPVVLDPTLLLNKEQWTVYSKDNYDSKYILIYMMATSVPMLNFAKELSNKTGYKMIFINSRIKKKIDAKYVRYADPGEFLGLFLNSAYIVTNSFHGTAFAINFNKEFFVDLKSTSTTSSRLHTLLEKFGLLGRQIHSANLDDYDVIDWDSVNKTLESERKKSMGFINAIIGITDEQN